MATLRGPCTSEKLMSHFVRENNEIPAWSAYSESFAFLHADSHDGNSAMTILAVLTKILYHLPESAFKNSYSFHDAVESALKKQGWMVIREFQVNNRGDGRRGFIDLAVMHPVRIGLELDRKSPQKKSLFKLKQFQGVRFVILRESRRIIPVDEQ